MIASPIAQFTDAHCHMADPRLTETVVAYVSQASEKGITRFIQGGVDPADWAIQKKLAQQFPGQIKMSFGLHPWWVATHSDSECSAAFESLTKEFTDPPDGQADPKRSPPVALGELGLDFGNRFESSTRPRQIQFFKKQLELAHGKKIPLVLHVVKAHAEVMQIFADSASAWSNSGAWRGIIHSFSADWLTAQNYLKLGLTLSISAGGTRKGFDKLRHAVVNAPGESLVIESDAPDQPPARLNGALNDATSLWDTAEIVAQWRSETAEQVLNRSAQNLARLFFLE